MVLRHKRRFDFGNLFSADQLFHNLKPTAARAISRIKRRERFREGELLLAAGETPRGIYVLCAGQARLSLNVGSKGECLVRLAEPGETLGLTETIADLPCRTSAETVSACCLDFIERGDFIRFLQDEREFCFRLVRMLGANIQKSRRSIRYSVLH